MKREVLHLTGTVSYDPIERTILCMQNDLNSMTSTRFGRGSNLLVQSIKRDEFGQLMVGYTPTFELPFEKLTEIEIHLILLGAWI